MIETDELKPKPRGALRDLVAAFDRWRAQKDTLPHTELAEIVLDESGYTEMWQKDRSADAAGRLENLKELVRSMEEFENLAGFLEHISLVMDTDKSEDEAVSIMTLHSAKGLEFDTVFLPGWEEGLFPHQRTLDDQGRAGLEEERRLAHVGLTRARRRAKIYFAANRRMHGLWSSNIPSRFLDELPEAHVEVTESKGGFGGIWLCRRLALRRDDPFRLELHARPAGSARRETRTRAAAAASADGSEDEADSPNTPTNTRPTIGAPTEPQRPLPRLRGRDRRGLHGGGLRGRTRTRLPAHHRRRAGREIHRHRLGLFDRRPRVPPEIRQRQRHRDRRQQAHHRVRQGRREAGGG